MTAMLDDLTVALKAELVRQERKAKHGLSGRAVPVDYTGLARVALQTIREPDDATLDVGRKEQGDCWGYESHAAAATFTAMIDAILEEKA